MDTLSYRAKDSLVHGTDARAKLVVLLAFSIALFCVKTWVGIGVFAVALFAVALASRISLASYARTLLPAAFILVFIWVCNSIPFDPLRSLTALMYIARIALIIMGSFIITFTTTSTELTDALTSLLRPLRVLRVPVDDIAFTLSLAIRFIPLVFEQLSSIKTAQTCRSARFSTGPLWQRLRTWMSVLIPLFVGFFRRADTVAEAMDARCYGAGRRTSLNAAALSVREWCVLSITIALCVIGALCL